MQLAASRYFKGIGIFGFFHAQADVGIQLAEQPVAQVAGRDVFAFLSGQRGIVYDKIHRNGRFGNFLERDCLRVFRRADGIADMDVRNARNSDNGADAGFLYIDFVQAVKFVQLADFDLFQLVRVVMVDNDGFLVDFQRTVVHLADADAPDIFVVVNRAD